MPFALPHLNFPSMLRPLLLLSFATLAACQPISHAAPEGKVKQDWSAALGYAGVIGWSGAQITPGDVYLVSVGPDQERQAWEAGQSFVPGTWLAHLPPASRTAGQWTMPPHGFTFCVENSQDLGLPTRALPVALGLTGMQGGTGSLTVRDAQVAEVPLTETLTALDHWAKANQPMLGQRVAQGGGLRVRVVTRVVGAKQILIFLHSFAPSASEQWARYDNSRALAMDPISSPVELDYRTRTMNDALKMALTDGGKVASDVSLRVVAMSARDLTLAEDWSSPLVIGYVAWEAPVAADGSLGRLRPTLAILNGQPAFDEAKDQ